MSEVSFAKFPGAAAGAWLRWGSIAALTLATAFPLVLVDVFAVDWINHLWQANYAAHMLASEGRLPSFINAAGQIGNPFPAYYGTGMFGLAAPFVLAFGVHAGMRLAILAAIAAPAIALSRFVRRVTGSDLLAAGLTPILGGSVYQLTNLYSRGALTEFFACQLLLLAAVLAVDALTAPARRSTLKLAFAILIAALTVLGHPLSAYAAGLFLAIPMLVLLAALRPRASDLPVRPLVLVPLALLAALPIGGWLALVLPAADGTQLALQRLAYYPHAIDSLYSRLVPWSTDLRVDAYGIANVSTPYLGAPVNLAALAALAALTVLAIGKRRQLRPEAPWLAFAGLIGAAALAAIFLSLPYGKPVEPAPETLPVFGFTLLSTGSFLHPVLRLLQFAYRLVNIANLAAALGVIGLLVGLARTAPRPAEPLRRRAWGLAALAGAGFVLVLLSAKAVEVVGEYRDAPRLAGGGSEPWLASLADAAGRADAIAAASDVTRLPPHFYGAGLFASRSIYPELEPVPAGRIVPLTLEGSAAASAEFACETACAALTDAYPSPLVHVALDGEPLAADALRVAGDRLTVLVGKPGSHRLDLTFGDWRTMLAGYGTTILAALAWVLGLLGLISAARDRLLGKP